MLQIKVFGTTPPCANCKRAETQALKAAEQFQNGLRWSNSTLWDRRQPNMA